MSKPLVLVIEDDRRYWDLLEMNLTRHGYRAERAPDALTGLNLLERDAPNLVVLDLRLPDFDGFELCQRIRTQSNIPIIILSGRTGESDKVRGLSLGADDYVTKPFGALEFVARVDAVLRRERDRAADYLPGVVVGPLTIDFSLHRVIVAGEQVPLTPLEYRLIQQLALHLGRVMTHEELLRRVWGNGYEDQTEVLHTAITRLRRKLGEQSSRPRLILTIRGVGYSLVRSTTNESPTDFGVTGRSSPAASPPGAGIKDSIHRKLAHRADRKEEDVEQNDGEI